MNSRSEASQPGGRGGHVTQFLFDIIGFSEILIFVGKLLGFATGKDRDFEFYGKISELAQSTP